MDAAYAASKKLKSSVYDFLWTTALLSISGFVLKICYI